MCLLKEVGTGGVMYGSQLASCLKAPYWQRQVHVNKAPPVHGHKAQAARVHLFCSRGLLLLQHPLLLSVPLNHQPQPAGRVSVCLQVTKVNFALLDHLQAGTSYNVGREHDPGKTLKGAFHSISCSKCNMRVVLV